MSWTLGTENKLGLQKDVVNSDEEHIGVKVRYFGVSSLDNNVAGRGAGLGTAAFGIVDKVPAGLAGSFAVGDWVGVTTVRSNCGSCNYCVRGRENLCATVEGGKKFGGVSYYSSYINAEPQWVFPVPRSIPEQSIVPLLNEGAVIYSALRRYARPGDSIGVIGAGSLGQLAVAYSRALGYKTTLVASKQQLGSYTPQQGIQLAEDISKQGYKFHVVLSTSAILTSQSASVQFTTTRRGGRFIILGATTNTPIDLPFGALIHEQRQIVFLQSGSRRDIHDALEVASKNKIHPSVQVQKFQQTGDVFTKIQGVQNGQELTVIQV